MVKMRTSTKQFIRNTEEKLAAESIITFIESVFDKKVQSQDEPVKLKLQSIAKNVKETTLPIIIEDTTFFLCHKAFDSHHRKYSTRYGKSHR